jgi:hypothetical protein
MLGILQNSKQGYGSHQTFYSLDMRAGVSNCEIVFFLQHHGPLLLETEEYEKEEREREKSIYAPDVGVTRG